MVPAWEGVDTTSLPAQTWPYAHERGQPLSAKLVPTPSSPAVTDAHITRLEKIMLKPWL